MSRQSTGNQMSLPSHIQTSSTGNYTTVSRYYQASSAGNETQLSRHEQPSPSSKNDPVRGKVLLLEATYNYLVMTRHPWLVTTRRNQVIKSSLTCLFYC
jgi:hypothetical protein